MNIDQLKQQLEEKGKEIKRITKIDNKTFLFETYEKPLREQIQLLKQQLVEKQSKIDEMSKEFVQAVHAVYDWRVLCAEKDKEIETMKKDSDKNIDYLIEFASLIENEKDCNRMLKALDRVKSGNKYIIDKANQSKSEFAIQELDKVKEEMDLNGNSYCEIRQGTSPHNPTDHAWFNYVKFRNYLNQQIKELKGD